MGHEMTGEVLEVGPDVEFLSEGDLVSVPFNVSCGRCRNCRARHTEVCETVNPQAKEKDEVQTFSRVETLVEGLNLAHLG